MFHTHYVRISYCHKNSLHVCLIQVRIITFTHASLDTCNLYFTSFLFIILFASYLLKKTSCDAILRSVHCLLQHPWCTLLSPGSLRTWISCQFSMLWLLVKFPLPYILHGDRKELILISLVSSRMWCMARRC